VTACGSRFIARRYVEFTVRIASNVQFSALHASIISRFDTLSFNFMSSIFSEPLPRIRMGEDHY